MKKGYINPTGKEKILNETTVGGTVTASALEWSGITVKSLAGGTFITTEGEIITLDEFGTPFDEIFIPMDEE